MDKKSYNLTETIDFVLGDESDVEELLSDSDFEKDILDSGPENALRNQSDSDKGENLRLQELVKRKEEKKDKTGTDNEKDYDDDDDDDDDDNDDDDGNPTQTHFFLITFILH